MGATSEGRTLVTGTSQREVAIPMADVTQEAARMTMMAIQTMSGRSP